MDTASSASSFSASQTKEVTSAGPVSDADQFSILHGEPHQARRTSNDSATSMTSARRSSKPSRSRMATPSTPSRDQNDSSEILATPSLKASGLMGLDLIGGADVGSDVTGGGGLSKKEVAAKKTSAPNRMSTASSVSSNSSSLSLSSLVEEPDQQTGDVKHAAVHLLQRKAAVRQHTNDNSRDVASAQDDSGTESLQSACGGVSGGVGKAGGTRVAANQQIGNQLPVEGTVVVRPPLDARSKENAGDGKGCEVRARGEDGGAGKARTDGTRRQSREARRNRRSARPVSEDHTLPTSYVEQVILELLQTERAYVKDLNDIITGYMRHICETMELHVTKEEFHALFCNLSSIYRFNSQLLVKLEQSKLDPVVVARIFVDQSEGFKIYTEYCTNYPRALAVLAKFMRNATLAIALQRLQKALKHQLPLETYLFKPVQRILKYHLLFKSVLSHHGETEPGHEIIAQALDHMMKVATEINETKRRQEHETRRQLLQTQLFPTDQIDLSAFGDLILEDKMIVNGGKEPKCIFLFSKGVLICKSRKDGILQMKVSIMCSNLVLNDTVSKEPLCFNLVPWNSPRVLYTLRAKNTELKRTWCQEIKRLIIDSFKVAIPEKSKLLLMQQGEGRRGSTMPKFAPPVPVTLGSPNITGAAQSLQRRRRARRKSAGQVTIGRASSPSSPHHASGGYSSDDQDDRQTNSISRQGRSGKDDVSSASSTSTPISTSDSNRILRVMMPSAGVLESEQRSDDRSENRLEESTDKRPPRNRRKPKHQDSKRQTRDRLQRQQTPNTPQQRSHSVEGIRLSFVTSDSQDVLGHNDIASDESLKDEEDSDNGVPGKLSLSTPASRAASFRMAMGLSRLDTRVIRREKQKEPTVFSEDESSDVSKETTPSSQTELRSSTASRKVIQVDDSIMDESSKIRRPSSDIVEILQLTDDRLGTFGAGSLKEILHSFASIESLDDDFPSFDEEDDTSLSQMSLETTGGATTAVGEESEPEDALEDEDAHSSDVSSTDQSQSFLDILSKNTSTPVSSSTSRGSIIISDLKESPRSTDRNFGIGLLSLSIGTKGNSSSVSSSNTIGLLSAGVRHSSQPLALSAATSQALNDKYQKKSNNIKNNNSNSGTVTSNFSDVKTHLKELAAWINPLKPRRPTLSNIQKQSEVVLYRSTSVERIEVKDADVNIITTELKQLSPSLRRSNSLPLVAQDEHYEHSFLRHAWLPDKENIELNRGRGEIVGRRRIYTGKELSEKLDNVSESVYTKTTGTDMVKQAGVESVVSKQVTKEGASCNIEKKKELSKKEVSLDTVTSTLAYLKSSSINETSYSANHTADLNTAVISNTSDVSNANVQSITNPVSSCSLTSTISSGLKITANANWLFATSIDTDNWDAGPPRSVTTNTKLNMDKSLDADNGPMFFAKSIPSWKTLHPQSPSLSTAGAFGEPDEDWDEFDTEGGDQSVKGRAGGTYVSRLARAYSNRLKKRNATLVRDVRRHTNTTMEESINEFRAKRRAALRQSPYRKSIQLTTKSAEEISQGKTGYQSQSQSECSSGTFSIQETLRIFESRLDQAESDKVQQKQLRHLKNTCEGRRSLSVKNQTAPVHLFLPGFFSSKASTEPSSSPTQATSKHEPAGLVQQRVSQFMNSVDE